MTEAPPAGQPSPARARAAVAVAAAAGVLVLIGAVWLARRDTGYDVARFFTLATPSVCSAAELNINLGEARFAAFLPGRRPDRPGDRFLSVDVSVQNAGPAPQAVDLAHFDLSDRPGKTFPASPADEPRTKFTGSLAPGEAVSDRIAFSLPASVGAAKLTYDDGCTRQEWLVP